MTNTPCREGDISYNQTTNNLPQRKIELLIEEYKAQKGATRLLSAFLDMVHVQHEDRDGGEGGRRDHDRN
jgi:hypothetical protein